MKVKEGREEKKIEILSYNKKGGNQRAKKRRSEKEKKRNEFCGEFKKDADGIRRKCEGGSRKISVGV